VIIPHLKRLSLLCAVALLMSACAAQEAPTPTPTATTAPTITPISLPTDATPSITDIAAESPTPSPSPTASATATLSPTLPPSATPTPTLTLTSPPSATPTATATPSPTPSATPTRIPPTAPPPITLTPPVASAGVGWSCGDFPCADQIDEWQRRIRVPAGFALEFVGQFPGQVNQIAYGPDGALYATVLENGTLTGAVWRLAPEGIRRLTPTLYSPFGLAFRPNTAELYISSRTSPLQGGSLWRLNPDTTLSLLIDDLPCCFSEVDNQPNGIFFGQDGALYMGIGSLTDRGEGANPQLQAWATFVPFEASIVRIDMQTGELTTFASGIRNPIDIAQDSRGAFFATDSGLVSGIGDRVLAITEGGSYGFPFYRSRGCDNCPPNTGRNFAPPDLLSLPLYTLPRGIVAYTGAQFPANFQDTLFVALWNAPYQMILWLDPRDPALAAQTPDEPYPLIPFVTGLLRPSDVIVDPEGALVIADWLHGHIWRVRYVGESGGFAPPTPSSSNGGSTPTANPPSLFATNTPAP
jgi:glucose/arabinose dehydrogenase